ncbi:conserved hypothetical protein [Streptomyces sviceus ATCC 29083]|uniref:LD-carboxypeptidase N-terminal domain-containing protein n=1 Tax=Streptomyces sviceus (strain ATCC 29083 / DSM 924 / JCM 4929 / NBRC 13980 / NCIMB 11184 / NRRL 5439 / UC 5370) TaxID=463191 RepID=B5HQU7_STRX2|nr:conserved hypothetical protein [Streptomyces sviceus ATCC 29083]
MKAGCSDPVYHGAPGAARPVPSGRDDDLVSAQAREYGLEPVEYPTTRRMGSTAVMASSGGDDQITVLPFLDRELIRANPKPFFGMSDNTNLLRAMRLYAPTPPSSSMWTTATPIPNSSSPMGARPGRRSCPAHHRHVLITPERAHAPP